MFCRSVVRTMFIALMLGMGSSASAGVLWNEAVNGDLSGNGLSPTPLGALTNSSNQIFGSTGRFGPSVATDTDRDYFLVSVPSGLTLNEIKVLPDTTAGGPLGIAFIGLEAGPQVTVPIQPATAAGLLGWFHYGPADIGNDILQFMSIPNFMGSGNTGFTRPLGPGNYAFWVQDTGLTTIPFNYGLEFVMPEPGTIAMLLIGLAGLGFNFRKRG
jgi:PEP-CTERM motif